MARWHKLQLPPPAQFPTKFTTLLTLILRLFLAPGPEKILIKTEWILGYLSPPISAAWKEVTFLRSGTWHRVTILCLSLFWHLVGEDWEAGVHVALKFHYFVLSPHACPVLKPGLLAGYSASCSSRLGAMNTSTFFLSLSLLKTGPTPALSTLICYQQPGLASPTLQVVR